MNVINIASITLLILITVTIKVAGHQLHWLTTSHNH